MIARADVVVIGAGPAGSTVAAALARCGRDVLIVEARAFPRAKVCGEFVSPAATSVLESLVPAGVLRAAGARTVDRFVLELGARERTLALPSPAWVLSRAALDALLLQQAVTAGARTMPPTAVRDVSYADTGVAVRLTDGREIVAALVIHADGSGRHDPAGAVRRAAGVVGLKCHYRPARDVHGVRIRACRGAYVGTVGVEDGRATLAMVVRTRLLRDAGGDADRVVRGLSPGFNPDRREGDWMSTGVARASPQRGAHPRSWRVGNAMAAVDPIGGEGIGLALWGGAILGDLLGSEAWDSAAGLARCARTWHALYTRRVMLRRPVCRVIAAALERPVIVRVAWPILGLGGVLGAAYRLTGKPARA